MTGRAAMRVAGRVRMLMLRNARIGRVCNLRSRRSIAAGVRGGVVHVLSEFRDWRDKAPHRQKQRGDKRKDSAKYLDFTDHRWIV